MFGLVWERGMLIVSTTSQADRPLRISGRTSPPQKAVRLSKPPSDQDRDSTSVTESQDFWSRALSVMTSEECHYHEVIRD